MCDGTALALHALHRVSGSLILDPHRLVKGRLVEPWLWVGIPISTLVGERGVCISAQYKHNITYSVDYMGNINQYTNLGFASVCIQVYISHIINWLGYIIYIMEREKREDNFQKWCGESTERRGLLGQETMRLLAMKVNFQGTLDLDVVGHEL